MKYLIFIFLVLTSNRSFSQDSVTTGMGSKNFDHLYAAIKQECGYENEYAGVKLNKKKVKKDLWIVSIVNDIVLTKLSIEEADSILKKNGIKPFVQPYKKDGYDASKIIINGTYIKFSIISATKKEAPITFVGATLKSTYDIHCKSNPLFVIPSVHIDVNFFKEKVMKKITCRYQIFNDLELGVANYMANELHFIF
jgi:hypothetical protein